MSHSHAPEYVLGTDAIEAKRLGLQHRIWSAAAHHLWELAGVRPGITVMDLGCGPGHATFDLATIVGGASPERAAQGRVIALDESATFLHQLNETAVTDAGIASLAKLPKVRSISVRKTAVTDEGIAAALAIAGEGRKMRISK